jgi:hypothetical protein
VCAVARCAFSPLLHYHKLNSNRGTVTENGANAACWLLCCQTHSNPQHTLIASLSASSFASTSRLALGDGLPTKKVREVSPW